MSLTIETGTGVAGADTYSDIAYTDAYLASMGYTIWAPLLTAEKEAAKRMAARWLDSKNYTGTRSTMEQGLEWPRVGGVFGNQFDIPTTTIPENLKRAECELAVRAAQGLLTTDSQGGYITHEQLGELSVSYSDKTRQASITRFKVVDDLLAPILSSNVGRVMRVL